ncbi:hypothetical protein KC19_5G090700 [Ceratodon purpureus]|uniref:Uncharacterized protein n=1 Tax=Ceratodon purpureus TaxID=3225 RepID=A0A8T0HZI1_CERPU|nr:hypothetical protein KC19_5G090700 [Ceratodon purpureus]
MRNQHQLPTYYNHLKQKEFSSNAKSDITRLHSTSLKQSNAIIHKKYQKHTGGAEIIYQHPSKDNTNKLDHKATHGTNQEVEIKGGSKRRVTVHSIDKYCTHNGNHKVSFSKPYSLQFQQLLHLKWLIITTACKKKNLQNIYHTGRAHDDKHV